MDSKIIDAVAAAGFSVYMRDRGDTYLMYTDGTQIGYLQEERGAGGYAIMTVHKPSREVGTGYRMLTSQTVIDREALLKGFAMAAAWAYPRDVQHVRKWKDWAEFHNSSLFHKAFQKVA